MEAARVVHYVPAMRSPHVLALCLGMLGPAATASPAGRNRFHLVDPVGSVRGVRDRLSKPAQKNLRTVARYTIDPTGISATGTLVAADAHGDALVLTANHVAASGSPATNTVGFATGGKVVRGTIDHVVAASPTGELDYALVAVKLPPRHGLPVAKVKQSGYTVGHEVYSSGFDQLRYLYGHDAFPLVASDVGFAAELAREGRASVFDQRFTRTGRDATMVSAFPMLASQPQTISLGRPALRYPGDPSAPALPHDAMDVQRALEMKAIYGGSGKAVFDAVDHGLVGIVTNTAWKAGEIAPIEDGFSVSTSTKSILGDLRLQLRDGTIAPADRARVEEFLSSAIR